MPRAPRRRAWAVSSRSRSPISRTRSRPSCSARGVPAEAILTGAIVEYERRAYTFDETDRVTEYIVEIWVDAELNKKEGAANVWKASRMRGFGIDKADTEDEQQGQTRAIEKIAEDLLNRTIKSW